MAVSLSFTVLALIACGLHVSMGWFIHSDLKALREKAINGLGMEAARMLRGGEIGGALRMAVLALAGAASFFPHSLRGLVALAIFVVPILSIAESLFARRSVAKQLRLAQTRR